MSKASLNKTKSNNNHYWNGVFTGVFLGCFFICISLLFFIRFQGLKVAINPGQLARLVQVKIEDEAKRDIPRILEEIKQELPAEIFSHLNGLDELTIGFGRSQVKLPEEVIAGIKEEFNLIIEEAIINTLNNYDTSIYQERIGKNAYEVVENILNRQIIGKTYVIKASQWFSVPVKIVGTTEKQLQIGI